MTEAPTSKGHLASARDQHLEHAIAAIGQLTRDFTARGTFPFQGRSLGRSQMTLLFALSQAGGLGLGVGALAAALGVTSSAVSQLVDSLRATGLVTSEVAADDQRARIIRLTDAAAQEVAAFQRGYVRALAPRFAALSTSDVALLARLLGKLTPGIR